MLYSMDYLIVDAVLHINFFREWSQFYKYMSHDLSYMIMFTYLFCKTAGYICMLNLNEKALRAITSS